MILAFGEILYDLFPGGKRLGGAPFNFAYHLKKLGYNVRFFSRIARDQNGIEILDFLKKNNFNTDDIQIDSKYKTGIVNVKMADNGEHVFEIVRNAAYDNFEYSGKIKNLINEIPELIYFGTLMQRSQNNLKTFNSILRESYGKTELFCDLNLRPACYNKEVINNALSYSSLLKINNDELLEIDKLLFKNNMKDPSVLLEEYNISNLIITKGENGSMWINKNGYEENNSEREINITDTVGAGDAFSAAAAAGYLQKLPVKKILDLCSEFASYICTIRGALPEEEYIYKYLKKEMEIK